MSSNKRNTRNRATRTVDHDVQTVTSVTAPPRTIEREAPAKVERIGDILRRERERRGYDLNRIADYLCIKQSFLLALENNQYDSFPADAYVIGFLRSYATYLDMDGKNAIDRYRHEMAGRRKKPILTMPNPITEGRSPSAIIIVGALVVSLGIYAAWYGISSSDRASVTHASPSSSIPTSITPTSSLPTVHIDATAHTPSSPAEHASTPEPEGTPALVAPPSGSTGIVTTPTNPATSAATNISVSPVPAMPPQPTIPDIEIHAQQPAWVLVNDANGKAVFDRILKAGEVYKVPSGKGFSLTTGNTSGILMTLDGAPLPHLPMPADGSHVLRNISLDPARLKTMPAPAAE